MIVYGPPPEKKKLLEIIGSTRWHPETEKQGFGTRPSYLYISVDGKEELFVNEVRGPILSVAKEVGSAQGALPSAH